MSILFLTASIQANAATAIFVKCEPNISVSGKTIYVGTYEYMNRHFQKIFPTFCPFSIDIQ